MELKEFLKLIFLNRRYILASVIICLMIGYFYILNEGAYKIASFSVYAKLNPINGRIDENTQNNYDQIKNTFFIIKTAESFIDSIRFWLVNDFKLDDAKLYSRKITPQHLFIQIRQKKERSLILIKDAIIEGIRKRQTLIVDENLKLFSIESSDYKESQNQLNSMAVISLSLLVGIFVGTILMLLSRYLRVNSID